MQRTVVAQFLLLLVLMFVAMPGAWAQSSANVQRVDVTLHEDGWRLDADIEFQLNPQLREAVERGLPLHFSAQVEITRPRWWWFDHEVVKAERLWSISYNALLRQWRVSTGGLALPVTSLDDALALVRHIGSWVIAPPDAFRPGEDYEGKLRLHLDVSQLSRPLQVDALNSSAWALATPWTPFTIHVPAEGGNESEPASAVTTSPAMVPFAEPGETQ
jgi:hypothetical protein